MNQSIDRRIAALEAVSGSADFVLVVRRIVSPGEVPGEAAFATALGIRLTREPFEAEDAFIDRVHDCAEANCPTGQRAVRACLDFEFE